MLHCGVRWTVVCSGLWCAVGCGVRWTVVCGGLAEFVQDVAHQVGAELFKLVPAT